MAVNLATRVTLARLLLVPLFVLAAAYELYEPALALFVLAGLSDALDGLIARALKQRTQLGAVLDALADKFLILGGFVVLSLVPGQVLVPAWLTVLVVSRDVLIVITAVSLFSSTGRRGFAPTRLGKATTFTQILFVALVLEVNAFGFAGRILPVLALATGAMTVISGLDYIRSLAREAE